jgi:hypothetical protein
MTKFFYTRVSTVGQSVSRQIENFKNIEGYTSDNLFIDKVQGNIPFRERPQASILFDVVTNFSKNEKVVIYIDSIDRLGRNMLDIISTIFVFSQNGVALTFLKEQFTTLNDDGSENEHSKLILGIMASISDLERTKIRERTKEGIALARAKGLYCGRRPGSVQTTEKLLIRHQDVVNKLHRKWSVRAISKVTGKSFQTIVKVRKVLEKRKLA